MKPYIWSRRPAVVASAFLSAFLFPILFASFSAAGGGKGRPALFLPEERQAIREYFYGQSSGLPPGLAKRGGNLPPGLQKQLRRNGRLPPGLEKRLRPLPVELERRLPTIPEIWQRVILGSNVILLDRRTSRILDIIEDVAGLVMGR